MPNPDHLSVTAIAPGQVVPLGAVDVIDTDGIVPVLGTDTGEMPELVVFDVVSNTTQTFTVVASDWDHAVRRGLGDLTLIVPAVAATLETALVGDDNDLFYTAVTTGTYGNSVEINYIDPAQPDILLSIAVAGTLIRVTLATSPTGVITTTAGDIITAIEGDEDASALVTVALADGNDGTGVVTAMAATPLAGGASGHALLGPFESARFEKANGDMDIRFDILSGQGFDVRAYLLPRGA